MQKVPFQIDAVMDAVRAAVEPFPRAALFALSDDGFRSAFELLVACIISIRTRDESTLIVARALFERVRAPADFRSIEIRELDGLIAQSSFHQQKARQIKAIAERVHEEYGGQLPCDFATLTSLPGVGAKCANLVLGIACGQPRIGVDIHVHRITNRWGYVAAPSPEGTLRLLEEKLPRAYWIEINALLVPFGKHVCTGILPKCSTCPILAMCGQVGVVRSH